MSHFPLICLPWSEALQKERAAVKVRRLRTSFFFFFGFSRPLNPRSGLRRPSTKASYGQPTINHGAVGEVGGPAIVLQILAGIDAKPSPLKGLGILPIQIFRPSYGLNHAPNVTDCTMTFYVISAKETRDLPNARSHWCAAQYRLDSKILPTI